MELEQPSAEETQKLHRALGVRDLVLFNIAAILGLRWLSTSAQVGPSSLVLWVLAMVVFFIPSALAVMELSSRMPGEGGIYLWTRDTLGPLHGFVAGWTYWVNNLFYFPSLLLFISGTFLFLGGDGWLHLAGSAVYNGLFTIGLLWLVTLLNVLGLERGKWIQNVGASSTWLVFIVLAVVGMVVWMEYGSATSFDAQTLLPDLTRFSSITFFATMTFAFAGLELAPIMAGEIRDPRKSIPRAIWISGLMIAVIYVVGTGFLMVSLPVSQIGVISGIPQAFVSLAGRLDFGALGFLGALLVVVASSGGLGAWVSGAARMPFVVGIDRYLPESLGRVHSKWGTPHVALVTQGVVATVLIVAAVAGSTVEEAYVVLLDMTIILYFIPFLYLFAILPFVRKRRVGDDGAVLRVPGGRTGVWAVTTLGFGATMLSIVLAMIPPEDTEEPTIFLLKTIGGTILFLLAGLAFYYRGRTRPAGSTDDERL